LLRNDAGHTLHGGPEGFHCRLWDVLSADDTAITLRLISPDGDQGFPGRLTVTVEYRLVADSVMIHFTARTDATTVVNLASHAHFNLAGEGQGSVEGHLLQIDADRYTPVGPDLIPTGTLENVAGTPLDFRMARPIGDRIRHAHEQLRHGRGYDHNYVLNRRPSMPAAVLSDLTSGRRLEVHTDQPGLQVYTTNFLDGSHIGTGGSAYRQGDGIALETQHFPDSPHWPHFPSTVLRPGEALSSRTTWRFLSQHW